VAEGELVCGLQGGGVVLGHVPTQAVAGHVGQEGGDHHILRMGQLREAWLVWRWSERVSMEVVLSRGEGRSWAMSTCCTRWVRTYRVSKASRRAFWGSDRVVCHEICSENTGGAPELGGQEDNKVVGVDGREEGGDVAGNAEELFGLVVLASSER
jgi:hypothetical protein